MRHVDMHVRGLATFDISHMPATCMTIIKADGCDQLI